MKLKSKNLKLLELLPLIHVQYLAKHKMRYAQQATIHEPCFFSTA